MENYYECKYCLSNFDNKEKFIKHIFKNHMHLKYTCDECNIDFKIRKKYHNHMRKTHKYNYCEKCGISFKKEEKHECGDLINAFLCDLGNCREKYYYRLNFFVRHLQIEHKIAEFDRIQVLIENNCRELIKPYKKNKKATSSKNRMIKNYSNKNQDFEEFRDYANIVVSNTLKNLQSSSSDFESEEDEEEDDENSLQLKSSTFNKDVLKNLKIEEDEEISFNHSHKKKFINDSKMEEKKQKKKKFITSSSAVLDQLNKNKIKKFKKTSQKKSDIPAENEYELLLCRYKDNKRFIKSIKYEDLLLKALGLVQSIQTKKKIFSIFRYGRPFKGVEHYDLKSFFPDFKIKMQLKNEFEPEFETLIEKQWMVRNYSKINHKLFEHKRHSNYMLNKRLRLVCVNCGNNSYKFFDAFIKHYKLCLFESINVAVNFKCPICSGFYLNYFALIQHLEIEHFII